jgi:spore coat polysaccharide biosynthesis protein SpsF
VRVTADCPLIDPAETDLVIEALVPGIDYAANVIERDLPRGLDVEALWRDTLERVDRMATSAPAREHVTYFIHTERPELFELRPVRRPFAAADLRWTVDTPADLELVRRLYDELGLAERPLPLADVIAHVRAHPELAVINADIAQKAP